MGRIDPGTELNISPARCGVVPMPASEIELSWIDLAVCTSSGNVFTGRVGLMTRTSGEAHDRHGLEFLKTIIGNVACSVGCPDRRIHQHQRIAVGCRPRDRVRPENSAAARRFSATTTAEIFRQLLRERAADVDDAPGERTEAPAEPAWQDKSAPGHRRVPQETSAEQRGPRKSAPKPRHGSVMSTP